MDSGSQQEIKIIDKDESSDHGFHVVGGFVIEDSKTPYVVCVYSGTPLSNLVAVLVRHPLFGSKSHARTVLAGGNKWY
jgi:hypothetical protein